MIDVLAIYALTNHEPNLIYFSCDVKYDAEM